MYQRSVKTNVKSHAKKTWRTALTTRGFTVLLGLGIMIIGVSLVKEIIRKVEIHRQISQLEQQVSDLETHNSQLTDMMAYFNSSSFQEKEAKTKLGLAEPGETMVVLPHTNTTHNGTTSDLASTEATAVAAAQLVNEPIYRKWQHYFFK